MEIHYFEDEYHRGMICFTCFEVFRLPDGKLVSCQPCGRVPAKIVALGMPAIRKYAKEYVRREIAEQMNVWQNLDQYLRKIRKSINRLIRVKYNGRILEGKITEISDALYITVELQKPLKNKRFFHLQWLIENRAKYFRNITRLLQEIIVIEFGDLRLLYEKNKTLRTIAMLNKNKTRRSK